MANNKNNKNVKATKEKLDIKTLWTRILCLFLAFMMLAGGVFAIIEALL